MKLPDFEWIKKSRPKLALGVFLGLVGLAALVRNLDSWRGFAEKLIQAGTALQGTPSRIELKSWLAVILFSLPAVTAVTGPLWIQSEYRRRDAERSRDERKTRAFKTLQGMMRAASRIREQLTPPALAPIKSIDRVRITYLIEKDFSATLYREFDIRSREQPLHFWSTASRASAYAQPVDYLDDIQFKVTDRSGRQLAYLPTENSPLFKEVVIYFLPRIEPGEEHARQVVISYRWPQMLRQMEQVGEEDFNYTVESKDPVPLFEVRFFMEPGTGLNLMCEVGGPQYGTAQLLKGRHEEKEWDGYVYRVENGPAGTARYSLTLRLKKP